MLGEVEKAHGGTIQDRLRGALEIGTGLHPSVAFLRRSAIVKINVRAFYPTEQQSTRHHSSSYVVLVLVP